MKKSLSVIAAIIILLLGAIVILQLRIIATKQQPASPESRTIKTKPTLRAKPTDSTVSVTNRNTAKSREMLDLNISEHLYRGLQASMEMAVLMPTYIPTLASGNQLRPSKIEISHGNPEWYTVDYYPDGYDLGMNDDPSASLTLYGRYDPDEEWYVDFGELKTITEGQRQINVYDIAPNDKSVGIMISWHEVDSFYSISATTPLDEEGGDHDRQTQELLTKLLKIVNTSKLTD